MSNNGSIAYAPNLPNEKQIFAGAPGQHVEDTKGDLADQDSRDNFKTDAMEAEQAEKDMTVMQAAKAYPMACFWAFIMSSTIIMESYCLNLIGNFVALPTFRDRFGVADGKGGMVIATNWQSALQVAGPLGALIGVFCAGPLVTRIGYRWSTIIGLMLLNAFIVVMYTANSLALFFTSQLLAGLPWGLFIAVAPAYCSEIVPMRLRAPATQMLQLFWCVGGIIGAAVTYVYSSKTGTMTYRIPTAIQWIFPTPLAIALFLAPESPWWLVRKGKMEQAARSVERLGTRALVNSAESVAMMRRVIAAESTEKPSIIELFKGTDLRRTLIICGIYIAQNLAGNLIANQAVFFFEQAGMGVQTAFALGLASTGLQALFVIFSWGLTTHFGRRTIYLWGTGFNVVMLIALGVAASVGASKAASNAQASFGLIVTVAYSFAAAPAAWVVIGETSAIRLRPLSTGIGRASYYIINIPCIFLGSWMLNPTGANLGGKCGFIWGGTAFATLVVAFFCLPEMKGRSYREIDIMFKRRLPARQFKKTELNMGDDE